jgi:hypothetical protein
MKIRAILIVILILTAVMQACTGEAGREYFTGTVEYAYTYESNVFNTDSLRRERPSKGLFRYDENNYQSRFTGKDTITYNYSGFLNKCVSVLGNSNDYSCEDYSAETDSVLSWKLYDTTAKVMGQSCHILELQKKNSWVKYYVSRESFIAPATYRKHRSYNMDFYGDKANGGLILKMEHRFKYFTMKGEAVAVSNGDKDFSAFDISAQRIQNICAAVK